MSILYVFKFCIKLNQYYEDYHILDWLYATQVHVVMWLDDLVFGLNDPPLLLDCLSGWNGFSYLKWEHSLIHAPSCFIFLGNGILSASNRRSLCVDKDSLPHPHVSFWEGDISQYDHNVADLVIGCSSIC